MGKQGRDATFGASVRACYENRISLNEFFRVTEGSVTAFAEAILRRYKAPPWVAVEDMAQQFKIGCVLGLRKYDPSHPRARSVEEWVFYWGGDKAKKWLHKQRGAKLSGNADREPSRFEVLFVDVAEKRQKKAEDSGTPLEVEAVIPALAAPAPQEAEVERRQAWRRLLENAPDTKLFWGVLALANAFGEERRAAELLYQNVDVRCRLRLGNEEAAERVIRKAVDYVRAA